MKQTCPGKEHLFACAIHALEPAEEQRARAHLDRCPGCREVVAAYQHLEHTLDEWKPVAPSPWFDARTRARVSSPARARPRRLLDTLFERWLAVAVALVVAVALGVVVFRNHSIRAHQAAVEAIAKNAESPTPSPATALASPETKTAAPQQSAEQELDLYNNLQVLENYDLLANFDVISELPQPSSKVND